MQNRQKDGALDRELETSSTQKLLDNGLAAGLAPQPTKQQRERLAGDAQDRLIGLLRFLSPVTGGAGMRAF